MSQAPLVLVDGSSYLYRAFHALPPLTTSTGMPTGAVKGVLNMLLSLRKQYPDSPFAVVFDAKGPTFRDELFEHYKSHRPPMPDDLRVQVEPLHDCVRALGLPLLCVEGVEADDVIGTLARRCASQGRDVVISTGDKDMAQLVCPHVSLVNTMTGSVYDVEGVKAKFGVGPELIIDYLALMGDKVDNIPGVPGVGEKTAQALLNGIPGGLDGLYANLDQVATLPIRGARTLGAKLAEHREAAYLSYQLATIKTDVALELDVDALHPGEPQREALITLYRQLEFRSWLDALLREAPEVAAGTSGDLFADTGGAAQAAPAQYVTLTDPADFQVWLERLNQAEHISFNTKLNGSDPQQADLVGLAFAVAPGEAAYLPLAHSYMGVPAQLDRNEALAALKPLLEDPARPKVVQNGKADIEVLARYGINLRGLAFDTMLESYVLDSTATRHDLDSLALKYLGRSTTRLEDIAGKGAKQLSFDQVALEQAGPYAAEGVDVALALHRVLWERLQAIPSLAGVLRDIEMPLMPVLARIECNGAYVDANLLGQQSLELGQRMAELEREAYAIAGEEFNLGSPKQLGAILYDKLGLPVLAKTATGQPSTAESVLAELAEEGYPLPQVIMHYRQVSKLKSTYTDRLPEQINPRTGRIHTSYHQAVTATGRLSSSDPNLQNIPIRTAEGRRIRQAFIAPPGFRLLAADYSQIELRIMAHLAQDEGLLNAFRQGLDVHRATAAEVFGVPLEQVSAEQRRRAKAINFGLIYGMSAFGLAKQIGVDRKEAQAYIDLYFARYPGVLDYMERTRVQAREQGFVETLFGRRLYLPEIQSRNGAMRKAAERTAINAPMQGTAADIMKRAMVAVDGWLQDSGLDARVILQVHDELVLEVREDLVAQVREPLVALMSQAASLSVPLVVETGEGANWDEAH
jgi:DNA polymerase-1